MSSILGLFHIGITGFVFREEMNVGFFKETASYILGRKVYLNLLKCLLDKQDIFALSLKKTLLKTYPLMYALYSLTI